mgnify:CR=1 FL=1
MAKPRGGRNAWRGPGVGLLLLTLWSAPGLAAECRFEISNEWASGYTGSVQVHNDGVAPMAGWTVGMAFADGAAITQIWNAQLSGSGPYQAHNMLYNGAIMPGRSVQFGFNAAKATPGAAARAPVFGGVCEPTGGGNSAPEARIEADTTTGPAPLTVQFDGRTSSDADGDALRYAWDFGDGDLGEGSSSAAAAPSQTFATPGDYTVTLHVHDGQAESAPATLQIQVSEPASSGEAHCSFAVEKDWLAGYTGSVRIHNPTPAAIDGWHVRLHYPGGTLIAGAWNAQVSGTAPRYRADNASYNRLIPAGGSVSFGYNADKPQEGTAPEQPELAGICDPDASGPANQAPSAAATATPASGLAPLDVRFDGTASSDPDGDALQYLWEFADGSSADTAVVERRYEEPGDYSATLTVRDGRGGEDAATVAVRVSAPQPNAAYSLDPALSTLHFVSTKKVHVIEAHTFTTLSGAISEQGLATMQIDLNSVESGIAIRNERMRDYLFETQDFPLARAQVDVSSLGLAQLAPGQTREHVLDVTVDLHGIAAPVSARLRVSRVGADKLLVQTAEPILIQAADFALVEGVEILRELASLNVISYAVPVNLSLLYVAQ